MTNESKPESLARCCRRSGFREKQCHPRIHTYKVHVDPEWTNTFVHSFPARIRDLRESCLGLTRSPRPQYSLMKVQEGEPWGCCRGHQRGTGEEERRSQRKGHRRREPDAQPESQCEINLKETAQIERPRACGGGGA